MTSLKAAVSGIIFLIITIILIPNLCYSDDIVKTSKLGISASMQSGQTDIIIPFWTSEKAAIMPSIGVSYIGDYSYDFHIGMGIKFALEQGQSIPYAGLRAAALIFKPKNRESSTDIIGGAFIGGEHFFDESFSIGVEGQLNIAKSAENSSRFGNPDKMSFNTAAAIIATYYFE